MGDIEKLNESADNVFISESVFRSTETADAGIQNISHRIKRESPPHTA